MGSFGQYLGAALFMPRAATMNGQSNHPAARCLKDV